MIHELWFHIHNRTISQRMNKKMGGTNALCAYRVAHKLPLIISLYRFVSIVLSLSTSSTALYTRVLISSLIGIFASFVCWFNDAMLNMRFDFSNYWYGNEVNTFFFYSFVVFFWVDEMPTFFFLSAQYTHSVCIWCDHFVWPSSLNVRTHNISRHEWNVSCNYSVIFNF